MPTAAKLVAAIAFGLVAYYASQAVVPMLPEGMRLTKFFALNVALGAVTGWLVMGRLAGAGYGLAVANGLRTSAVLLFYTLLVHAIIEMIDRAVDMRYKDTFAALSGLVGLTGHYAAMVFTSPVVMGILILGGVIAALVVEFVSHRWN
jgi:hypothetical protein